jgi:adenylosuccinate synthase
MKTTVVIGGLFGDEGKGKTVSYLCSKVDPKDTLVVRFSGAHQAGHNVIVDNVQHVFSNFGSGTLQGIPTYWSKFCAVDPLAILKELDILKKKGIEPLLFLDERCPITTPYDRHANRTDLKNRMDGTCGNGVGATYERQEKFYSLTVFDLKFPNVFREKLKNIGIYYNQPSLAKSMEVADFIYSCDILFKQFSDNIKVFQDIFSSHMQVYKNYIFEGAQGLLLDQNFGFFPNVTRGNTGTKNIFELGFLPNEIDEVIIAIRAYQTRHGNGFMSNENFVYDIYENPYEINVTNEYQGKFRKTILDLDLLKYALQSDPLICNSKKVSLMITCLDVMNGHFPVTFTNKDGFVEFKEYNNEEEFINKISKYVNIKKIYCSYGPHETATLKEII